MELTRLVGTCPDGDTCPAAFTTDRGTIVIRGFALTDAELSQANIADGEAATEIPVALLLEAAYAYGA